MDWPWLGRYNDGRMQDFVTVWFDMYIMLQVWHAVPHWALIKTRSLVDITMCHDSHLNFCGDEERTRATSSTESIHDARAHHNMCQSPSIGHGYQLSLYCYSCALKDMVQAQTCVMCGIHSYLLGGWFQSPECDDDGLALPGSKNKNKEVIWVFFPVRVMNCCLILRDDFNV